MSNYFVEASEEAIDGIADEFERKHMLRVLALVRRIGALTNDADHSQDEVLDALLNTYMNALIGYGRTAQMREKLPRMLQALAGLEARLPPLPAAGAKAH